MNADWKAEDFERPPLDEELRRVADEWLQEKARQNPDATFGEKLQWLEDAHKMVLQLQQNPTSSTRSEEKEHTTK